MGVSILAAVGSALMVYATMHWRARSAASGRWYTAAALGAVTALLCGGGSFVYSYLLASATWGNHAGSDFFERNRLVDQATPAWGWWHLVLFGALIAISVVIARGPTGEGNSRRRCRWHAYVMLVAIPASSLGALVTTALIVV